MSEAMSALAGVEYDGMISVREAGLRGMATVRGDLGDAAIKNAVTALTGVDFPAARGINQVGEQGIAWMSPDELLVQMPYAGMRDSIETLETALKGHHVLVADVSDARVVFELEGTRVREVLAKLTPADLSPGALQPGEIRRTRLAQVAAAFWFTGPDRVELVGFRSVAKYLFELLKTSARPGGEVDFF